MYTRLKTRVIFECNNLRMTMEDLKSYLNQSSIHGFHYIAGSTRRTEKIFWLLMVFTGFSTAVFILRQAFNDWKNKPMVSMVTTIPIDDVPFPAISFYMEDESYFHNNVPQGMLQSILNFPLIPCTKLNEKSDLMEPLDSDGCRKGMETILGISGNLIENLTRHGIETLEFLFEVTGRSLLLRD